MALTTCLSGPVSIGLSSAKAWQRHGTRAHQQIQQQLELRLQHADEFLQRAEHRVSARPWQQPRATSHHAGSSGGASRTGRKSENALRSCSCSMLASSTSRRPASSCATRSTAAFAGRFHLLRTQDITRAWVRRTASEPDETHPHVVF